MTAAEEGPVAAIEKVRYHETRELEGEHVAEEQDLSNQRLDGREDFGKADAGITGVVVACCQHFACGRDDAVFVLPS